MACVHLFEYQIPTGSRHGVGICRYCHIADPEDVRTLNMLFWKWDDLRNRVQHAERELRDLAEAATGDEAIRLGGKLEGAALAGSYIDEVIREMSLRD